MPLSIALRRRAYRLAFHLLRMYWFIRRPVIHGVKCVLTDGDRVLLVRHTYGPPGWELPGGAVKRGEPPARAARREMEEELGLRIDDLRPSGELQARIWHGRNTLHLFRAEVQTQALKLDLGELETARWFRRGELPPDLGAYVPPILATVT